ncbi:MAG: ribbon-helix-helix protein, CopG family [Ruminiclostridium sp.]|jgi:metal-responsive CopG/Arc/MetJ family transcriptional regulator|nr:ribbon-helix-helix protein, CopG family [Ruminiclostridium sp.]
MADSIKIKRYRGDDGHKVVSVRMRDELVEKLDRVSAETNRSRNEIINLLLEAAVDIVEIEE